MTIKSTGTPLSFTEIVAEFGGSTPHKMSEYYAAQGYVMNDSGDIPEKGPISASNFYGSGFWWKNTHSQKLTASDYAASDQFGISIHAANGILAVGSPYEETSLTNSGAVYIFERGTGATWTQTVKLVASDAASNDNFGLRVYLCGEYLAVASPGDDSSKGSVYIFKRASSTSWTQIAKIVASDGAANDLFGTSICMANEFLIVGAPNANATKGAAYIYTRDTADVYTQTVKLTATDGVAGDAYGKSVNILGGSETATTGTDVYYIAFVGAPNRATNTGAVYQYNRTTTTATWAYTVTLTASNAATGNYFGWALSSNQNNLAIGAYGCNSNTGAVYLFYRTPSTNAMSQKLIKTAYDGATNNYFGSSVSLIGDYLLVGAYGNSSKGATYLYEHNISSDSWSSGYKFFASDAAASDNYGWSVTASGHQVIIAAPLDDDNAASNSGSVYVYSKENAKFYQKTTVYTSTSSTGDMFGRFLSINGNYAFMSMQGDDSDTSLNSGSFYAFERNATTGVWTQKQQIFSSVPASAGAFGRFSSMYGAYALVGATGEDSKKGSITAYSRSGSTWTEIQRFTGSDAVSGTASTASQLGSSVTISQSGATAGSYAIVGGIGPVSKAYIFKRDGTSGLWTESQILTTSDSLVGGSGYGWMSNINGNYAAVGANGDDTVSVNAGSVYVYQRNTTTDVWSEIQKINKPTDSYWNFGTSVCLMVNYLVIGATGGGGCAYIYKRNTSTNVWELWQTIRPNDGGTGDMFGRFISMAPTTYNLCITSPYSNNQTGAVYYYTLNTTTGYWEFKQKIIANDGNSYDRLGFCVAQNSTYIAVGASESAYHGLKSGCMYIFEPL